MTKINFEQRIYSLNIPQMLWGGVSENWLLKEFGDIHWKLIAKGLETESDRIIDSNGNRLYASFVRIKWEAAKCIALFKENEEITLEGKLSKYGNKMFFSNITVKGNNKEMTVQLMSVFSSRNAENNEKLVKGTPLSGDQKNIPTHPKLPVLAKNFFKIKSSFFNPEKNEDLQQLKEITLRNSSFTIEPNVRPLFLKNYRIDSYDDINGVGLLYFASYPKISDKCELDFFQEQYIGEDSNFNWAKNSSTIARDIHYYGNANANEELEYQLEHCGFIDSTTIQLVSSLKRKKDEILIAKIYTVKKLLKPLLLGSNLKAPKKQNSTSNTLVQDSLNVKKQEYLPKKPILVDNEISVTNKDTIVLTEAQLSPVILDFFSSILDRKDITIDTDLRKLGVESIFYIELSEHLNLEFGLQSNPSAFYGLFSVQEIVNFLLPQKTVVPKNTKEGQQEKVTGKTEAVSGAIAIVGVSLKMPGANTETEFWENLINKISCIVKTPVNRWEWPEDVDLNTKHSGANYGGYVNDIDKFDASFFQISPREAQLMDPQQRILLELTWQLLENSGYKPSRFQKTNTGVFIGASGCDYENLLQAANHKNPSATGTAMSLLSNRISYFYDLAGPSLTLDTACSSSLVAISNAVSSIRLKQCDQAIVGGIHIMSDPTKSIAYKESNMLSPNGQCFTFDEKANGYVRGEGAVMMLLKPLAKAIEDHDTIKAVIKSAVVNHGGYSGGITVPNPNKQKQLIEQAYIEANTAINEVSYIEAHGTGTSLGDPIEILGLSRAFKNLQPDAERLKTNAPWCGLGSVKTNLGHLEAASGIAGLLKVIMAMKNNYLPPNQNFESLNKKIELENSPFYILKEGKKWFPKHGKDTMIAGVSSFGIGGTNAHIVLESHRSLQKTKATTVKAPFLFMISARKKELLNTYVKNILDYLHVFPSVDPYELSYTLQISKEEMEYRLAFDYLSIEELKTSLKKFLEGANVPQLYHGKVRKVIPANDTTKALNSTNLNEIARAWCQGHSINRDQLYPIPVKTLDVPSYPFNHKKGYWFYAQKQEEHTKETSKLSEKNNSVMIKNTHKQGYHATNNKEKLYVELSELLCGSLFLESSELERDQTFLELGLDSILSVEFVKKINQKYDLSLATTLLYNYPTLDNLTEYLNQLSQNGKEKNTNLKPESTIDLKESTKINLPPINLNTPHFEGIKKENILKLLSEILYLEAEELDEEKSFLELGLDSILAVEFIKKLNAEFKVALGTSKLYDYPTVKILSEYLQNFKETSATVSTPEKVAHPVVVHLQPLNVPTQNPAKDVLETTTVKALKKPSVDFYSIISKLLATILYLEEDELNPELTFLELGLDSILGVELIKAINKELSTNIATSKLYDYPTLFQLSHYLEDLKKATTESAEIAAVETSKRNPLPAASGDKKNSENKQYTTTLSENSLVRNSSASSSDSYQKIKGLVCKILYLEENEFDPEQTFLELGLDSILGVELIKAVNKELSIDISSTKLYDYPTLLSLSSYIENLSDDSKFSEFKEVSGQKDQTRNTSVFTYNSIKGNLEIEGYVTVFCSISVVNNCCLKDHRVFKKHVLPTDAYIELLYDFLINTLNFKHFNVYDLRIAEPLIAEGNYEIGLQLELKKVSGGKLRFKTTSLLQGVSKMHMIGFIDPEVNQTNSYQEHLIPNALQETDAEYDLYALSEWTQDILQGSYVNIRQSLKFTNNKIKGILKIEEPQVLRTTIAQVLDGAFLFAIQYAGYQFTDGQIKEAMYLPYRLGTMNIFCGIKENTAYNTEIICTYKDENNLVFDLQIWESEDALLLDIQDLELRKIEKNQILKSVVHKPENKNALRFQESSTSTSQRKPFVAKDISEINKNSFEKSNRKTDVAIIGLSCKFPKAENANEFWENLKNGIDAIEEINPDKWQNYNWYHPETTNENTSYSKWGGFLKDTDKFDPLFFGISPKEAEIMDPQQRLFLEESWKAIEDAGYAPKSLENKNVGVFVGASAGDYRDILLQTGGVTEGMAFMGNSQAILSARIAYFLNLKGPALTIDTACSSSLVAIDRAYQSIVNGECKMALTGGIALMNTPLLHIWTSQVGMPSKEGRCKTFDNTADGIVSAEGIGVLLLKNLEDAERDGDHIYATIKGSGINQDGKTNGITAPSSRSQTALQQSVYQKYNIKPAHISYVEAHGTGTKLGDPIEVEALTNAFRKYTDKDAYCALGSVKSNIGHAAEAAGSSGIIKIIMMLKHKKYVPSLHYHSLNDEIRLENSPFYINTETKEWHTEKNSPRMAAINSFGFSGTNAHIVLQEYVSPNNLKNQFSKPEIIVLSAKNQESLKNQAKNLLRHLENFDDALCNISYTLQTGRDPMPHRIAFTVKDSEELKHEITNYLSDAKGAYLQSIITKNKIKGLFSGEAGKAFLNIAIEKQELKSIAQLWIEGVTVDWSKLHTSQLPQKISLPAYPFLKEKYWASTQSSSYIKANSVQESKPVVLSPMVHLKDADTDDFCYQSLFNGSEPFFADHLVKGIKMLPGVAYLEMVREATWVAIRQKIQNFQNVTWLTPITEESIKNQIHIALTPDNESFQYEVYSLEDATKTTHCQGSFSLQLPKNSLSKVTYDYTHEKLINSNIKTRNKQECYDYLKSKDMNLGKSLQGIQMIYLGDDEALSCIEIPVTESEMKYISFWDCAVQTCANLVFGLVDGLSLPFGLKNLELIEDIPSKVWCHVIKSKNNIENSAYTNYNIFLFDDDKNMVASFKDLSLLSTEGYVNTSQKKNAIAKELHIYPVVWSSAPIAATKIDGEHIIILADAPPNISEAITNTLQIEVFNLKKSTEITTAQKIIEYLTLKSYTDQPLNISFVYRNEEYMEYAFLSGIFKSLALENQSFTTRTIGINEFSLNQLDTLVLKLEKEFQSKDKEIKYEQEDRQLKKLGTAFDQKSNDETVIKKGGTYLLTGGFGKIGILFAKYIDTIGGKTILIGRRSQLTASEKSLLSTIETADYISCDITIESDLEHLKQMIFTNKVNLHGILHMAGVVRDKILIRKENEDIKAVLAPKIIGAKNLDKVFKEYPLDFFAVFSSIASITGNIGQSDYAAANHYLDNFANHRNQQVSKKRRQGYTLSINWPFWEEGGMQVDNATKENLKTSWGMKPLATANGITAFSQILNQRSEQSLVIQGNKEQIEKKSYLSNLFSDNNNYNPVLKQPEERIDSPSISVIDAAVLQNTVEKKLTSLASGILKLQEHKVSVEEELGSYGFDSISLTKLSNKLNKEFGLNLMPTIFYNYPTIKSLTTYLLEEEEAIFKNLTPAPAPVSSKKLDIENKNTAIKQHIKSTVTTLNSNNYPIEKEIDEPIAIVGMSGKFPQSKDIEEFWENLKQNKDLITEIPEDRWDWRAYHGDPDKEENKTDVRWGGFMPDVDKFDPLFFNISPAEAKFMDPQQRLAIETVYHALEDASITPQQLKGTNTGIFLGISTWDYLNAIAREGNYSGNAYYTTGSTHSVAVNRISYLLDIHGPSEPIDTACSSSLVSIHHAIRNIKDGNCDIAIAGGVGALLSPELTLSFTKAGMLSKDGRSKTFDESANGYARGEGVGIVILKKLSKAVADQDQIHAVIKGSAYNHGGKANTLTSPNPLAQKEVLLKAYRESAVNPEHISYIEAHGTGTPLGDPIEIEGLKGAFKQLYKENNIKTPSQPTCAIGSVKANMGHAEAAAGITGLIKIVLSLKHKTIPGNPHLKTPNKYLQLEGTPLYLQKQTTDWNTPPGVPRVAGVSSFGFGGVNAHVVLEEYNQEKVRINATEPFAIIISAKTPKALLQKIKELKTYLIQNETDMHDIAYTLKTGREAMDERLGVIVNDKAHLIEVLTKCQEGDFKSTLKNTVESKSFDAPYVSDLMKKKDLLKLVQSWVNGTQVDWNLWYDGQKPNKLSLPNYPFLRKRYWFTDGNNVKNVVRTGDKLKKRLKLSSSSKHLIKRENSQNNQKSIAPDTSSEQTDLDALLNQKSLTKEEELLTIKSQLLSLLSRLLYLDEDEINEKKSFDEIGLDSITGVNLIKEINRMYYENLKISKLYDYPTLLSLSEFLWKRTLENKTSVM